MLCLINAIIFVFDFFFLTSADRKFFCRSPYLVIIRIIPVLYSALFFFKFKMIRKSILNKDLESFMDEILATLQLRTLRKVKKLQIVFFLTNLLSGLCIYQYDQSNPKDHKDSCYELV